LLGIVFLLPLLWLTLSGLALRYAEELGLEEATVGSGWVLRHYGMIPEGPVHLASAGSQEVAEWGEVLFLDDRMLDEVGELRGAVSSGGKVIVATPEHLLVYDVNGEWEQKLGEESLPGVPVERITSSEEGRVIVEVGGEGWEYDEALIGFEKVESGPLAWSEVRTGDAGEVKRLEDSLAEAARIPWSRVMLDLHSGNLGGTGGKLLVDLSGLGIILMSLMGLRLVFRKPRGGTAA
jgi:hypothetical protein